MGIKKVVYQELWRKGPIVGQEESLSPESLRREKKTSSRQTRKGITQGAHGQGSKFIRTVINAPGKEMCKGAKFANVTKLSKLFTVKTEVHEQSISQ